MLVGERGIKSGTISNIASDICKLVEAGRKVVVVNSGAVRSGKAILAGEGAADERACAAAGQGVIYSELAKAMAGTKTAQLLVAQEDVSGAKKHRTAQTISTLLSHGVIPIINENDATAPVEKKEFANNDGLAALVASGVNAGLLVILSDVDGLYANNSRQQQAPLDIVENVSAASEHACAGGTGKGGMQSKLRAISTFLEQGGTAAVIANGNKPGVLGQVASGEKEGTLFASDKLVMQSVKLQCELAKQSSKMLRASPSSARASVLETIAYSLEAQAAAIREANSLDVGEWKGKISASKLQRLVVDDAKISSLAKTLHAVAAAPDPLEAQTSWQAGPVNITKVARPLGVIALVYESRPDVTVETAAVALKAGNCIVLKGGKEAKRTSRALCGIIREALEENGLGASCVQLLETSSHNAVAHLLSMQGLVDVALARGGKELLRFVRENATVPVIETGLGNCHIFVDESADLGRAIGVILNAKTQKPSACNAAEKVLVHEKIAEAFLPLLVQKLKAAGVEVKGCSKTAQATCVLKAAEEDWLEEYSDMKIAVKVVAGVEEAVAHVNKYGTKHSDAILTGSGQSAEYFTANVDSAAAYVNASTRFTDGGQFGFGAEMGISTQKLHVRGPIGPQHLVTHSYKVAGDYAVRK